LLASASFGGGCSPGAYQQIVKYAKKIALIISESTFMLEFESVDALAFKTPDLYDKRI